MKLVLETIVANTPIVDAPSLPAPVSTDPADDIFLAAAVASGARLIVSGDRHLLAVSGWQVIEVLTPREFADRHLAVT